MLTTVLMCQQGIPFRVSPARTQMVEELKQRGSRIIVFFPGNIRDMELKKKIAYAVNTKRMHNFSIRKKIADINPDIVICFTIEDTNICFPLPSIMNHTDFYYYNLEIYVPSAGKRNKNIYDRIVNRIHYLPNKSKEIIYVRGCSAIVIQDRLRKRILKKYWIHHSKTWLIPNSYYSDHNEYHAEHKGGLIYSGSVGEDVLGSFIEHVDDFKNIKLTVSGWNGTSIKLKQNPWIKVIKQNISQEKYTEFISAYDIALIWYSDQNDDNVYNIGLASGKLFKHLSLGQPVIVNNVPGLAEEVRKNKLGVVINDLRELDAAVRTIMSDYQIYSDHIKEIYDEKYDYKKVSRRFFDSIVLHACKKEPRIR